MYQRRYTLRQGCFCLHVCMWSEEGIRSPGIGVKDSLSHHVVLGIGPGSSTITVEPSLQSLDIFYFQTL